MKITKVSIAQENTIGLSSIEMSRLGNTVIITGKNGSGKTRLLKTLKSRLSLKQDISEESNILKIQKELVINQASNRQELKRLDTMAALFALTETQSAELQQIKLEIEKTANSLAAIKSNHPLGELIVTGNYSTHKFINFVPNKHDLQDCNEISKSRMTSFAKDVETGGIDSNTALAILSKIQFIQDKWFNISHPEMEKLDVDKYTENKAGITRDYQRLCKYIKTFLGASLSRSVEGDATLFGFRIGDAKLSTGQKVLLQFCVALYSQQQSLGQLIVFMDEPENYLHPKVMLAVVKKIQEAVAKNGQLWIATHSINLAAHVDPTSLFYMEEGSVNYTGNMPKRVLEGLIGGEEEVTKLSSFLSLPEQMAMTQYAYECLLPPQVVMTGAKDPQTEQIHEILKSLIKDGEELRILDFGAGKGRLLNAIHEQEHNAGRKITDWLAYYAYDKYPDDRAQCQKLLNDVYGSKKKRHFGSNEDIKCSEGFNSFHIIIMCNVFHEIDPKDWQEILGPEGIVQKHLTANGRLLIVEDQLLPVGEKAHSQGFLVFNNSEFRVLFNNASFETIAKDKAKRLCAHFIPLESVKNYNVDTRAAAISELGENAKEKVKSLRENGAIDYKNGKLHAFWCQQMVNATLAEAIYGKKKADSSP
ncbi:MAG: AAA family ATPase [Algicola sp.]|nr:AAA family ATPase [Algicola sp.]